MVRLKVANMVYQIPIFKLKSFFLMKHSLSKISRRRMAAKCVLATFTPYSAQTWGKYSQADTRSKVEEKTDVWQGFQRLNLCVSRRAAKNSHQ